MVCAGQQLNKTTKIVQKNKLKSKEFAIEQKVRAMKYEENVSFVYLFITLNFRVQAWMANQLLLRFSETAISDNDFF